MLYLKAKNYEGWLRKKWLNRVIVMISPVLFFTSFYIEVVNILNQYNIFVRNPKYSYIIVCIMYAVGCSIICYTLRKREPIGWKLWTYSMIVIGIVCMAKQPPLQNTYYANIFETANTSVLISDFLKYGIIPVVEHYGGHMLYGVMEGIMYAVLNQDIVGSGFGVYNGYFYVILAMIFFWLVRQILNDELALLVTIIIPVNSIWEYYAMGVLILLAAIGYIKKRNKRNICILGVMCIIATLQRLDIGVAFIMATIISLIIYAIIYQQKKIIVEGIVSGGVFGVLGFLLWSILCLVKGVNPVLRLKEFIAISASNVNWAHNTIGGSDDFMFVWSYVFFPIFVEVCILYIIFSKKFRERIKKEQWLLLLILGFAYFFNFSRSLVRHSVVERMSVVIIWSGYLFLAIFLSYWTKKKKTLIMFLVIGVVFNSIVFTPTIFKENGFLDESSNNIDVFANSWNNQATVADGKTWEQLADGHKKVNRVLWSDELEQKVAPYRLLIDMTLKDGETFLDYSNRSTLYSLLGRRDPVYVSQSPIQVSDEFSQERFIAEVDAQIKDIPVVILPLKDDDNATDIDGIPNVYRYYKISEYIYMHYKPICSFEDVALWSSYDRYDKLKKNIADKMITSINEGYDGNQVKDGTIIYQKGFHEYNLQELPWVWATLDEKQAVKNPVLSVASNTGKGVYLFDPVDTQDKLKGNYLYMEANYLGQNSEKLYKNNDEIAPVRVCLGTFEDGVFTEKYRYNIWLKEGLTKNLLRISTDYYWYTDKINAIKIDKGSLSVSNLNFKILAGD